MKRHLLISYHTCPTERPGRDLAGGMNVLLKGFLRHTSWPTDVVTRSFGEYERVELKNGVTVHRLPCGATRPWTRENAWECLGDFRKNFQHWLKGRQFEVASAHYWMSGTLLSELTCPAGMIFHTLQVQKGAPTDALERYRQTEEERLAQQYSTAFLHWHDLRDAAQKLPSLRGRRVVRPGLDEERFGQVRPSESPKTYGWAARNDGIKNFAEALERLADLRKAEPSSLLRVAGMDGDSEQAVEFLGPLRPEEMTAFYAEIDQLWNFSRYETFGLGVLEALAQGATVGLTPHSDWAKRLQRLGIESGPGRNWSPKERVRALGLARAYSWSRALPSWERWLSGLAAERG